jgi:hypothetical protein
VGHGNLGDHGSGEIRRHSNSYDKSHQINVYFVKKEIKNYELNRGRRFGGGKNISSLH